MLSREHILQKLSSLKPLLLSKYPIKELGLFGSYARNEASENSDIDIIVEFSKPVGFAFLDLADELECAFNCKVDLVSKKGIKPTYFQSISEDLVYV